MGVSCVVQHCWELYDFLRLLGEGGIELMFKGTVGSPAKCVWRTSPLHPSNGLAGTYPRPFEKLSFP